MSDDEFGTYTCDVTLRLEDVSETTASAFFKKYNEVEGVGDGTDGYFAVIERSCEIKREET